MFWYLIFAPDFSWYSFYSSQTCHGWKESAKETFTALQPKKLHHHIEQPRRLSGVSIQEMRRSWHEHQQKPIRSLLWENGYDFIFAWHRGIPVCSALQLEVREWPQSGEQQNSTTFERHDHGVLLNSTRVALERIAATSRGSRFRRKWLRSKSNQSIKRN